MFRKASSATLLARARSASARRSGKVQLADDGKVRIHVLCHPRINRTGCPALGVCTSRSYAGWNFVIQCTRARASAPGGVGDRCRCKGWAGRATTAAALARTTTGWTLEAAIASQRDARAHDAAARPRSCPGRCCWIWGCQSRHWNCSGRWSCSRRRGHPSCHCCCGWCYPGRRAPSRPCPALRRWSWPPR